MEPQESPEEEKDGSLSGATDQRVVPGGRAQGFGVNRVFHVLLVEDDECTLVLISKLLRKCDYEVTAARNGREALQVLESERGRSIDLILTDILMPELNGMELVFEVVQREQFKNIPVIVMSSDAEAKVVMEVLDAGAKDYLIKPIRRNEIVLLWRHVLKSVSSGDEAGGGRRVALRGGPSASDATWQRGSDKFSHGRLCQKSVKGSPSGSGFGDDPARQTAADEAAQEEGGSGDSSGNASQTRAEDGNRAVDATGGSGRGSHGSDTDLAQSQDPGSAPGAPSTATGHLRMSGGCSNSPEARGDAGAGSGSRTNLSGSRGQSSEASREGSPHEEQQLQKQMMATVGRDRFPRPDASRLTIGRGALATSSSQHTASTRVSHGGIPPAPMATGPSSAGAHLHHKQGHPHQQHTHHRLFSGNSEGLGEQGSASGRSHGVADSAPLPQSNVGGSGLSRWGSGADVGRATGTSHFRESLVPRQRTLQTSLQIQPLNVEPLHPTASKVGERWVEGSCPPALRELLERGHRRPSHKRAFPGAEPGPGNGKQDDDSSADTVSKVAESLHNMKHARVGDGGASAFSPFTAVVSRPCARGDATAECRADALPQTKWGLAANEASNNTDSTGKDSGEVVQGWGPQASTGGRTDASMQKFLQAVQAVQEHAQYDAPQQQSNCAANRKAAIAKFREKRKARNFDKKVRYESRRRLAEARPRVRGQFVKATALNSGLAVAVDAEISTAGMATAKSAGLIGTGDSNPSPI